MGGGCLVLTVGGMWLFGPDSWWEVAIWSWQLVGGGCLVMTAGGRWLFGHDSWWEVAVWS